MTKTVFSSLRIGFAPTHRNTVPYQNFISALPNWAYTCRKNCEILVRLQRRLRKFRLHLGNLSAILFFHNNTIKAVK
jgi:hypothetical protein